MPPPPRPHKEKSRRFRAGLDTSLPDAKSLAGTMDWARPIDPAWHLDHAIQIGRPLPHLTPAGGGLAPTPYRSANRRWTTQKGLTHRGPLQKGIYALIVIAAVARIAAALLPISADLL